MLNYTSKFALELGPGTDSKERIGSSQRGNKLEISNKVYFKSLILFWTSLYWKSIQRRQESDTYFTCDCYSEIIS